MTLSPFTIFFWLALVFGGFLGLSNSQAASYDIKEDIKNPPFVIAERLAIGSDKVSDDIVELRFTTMSRGVKENFIMQCDRGANSMTIWYKLKDTLGSKAQDANGMGVSIYYGDEKEFKPGGAGTIYRTHVQGSNFADTLGRIAPLQSGFVVFEFYNVMESDEPSTIAYSMAIDARYFAQVLTALDKVGGVDSCDVDSGFAQLVALK